MSSHACGGACCRAFPMNQSPAKLGELYRLATSRVVRSEYDQEIVMVAEMLIPLHQEDDEQPIYTCRNLDTETGLCGVYETRPKMCQDYPEYTNRGTCDHCGCGDPVEHETMRVKYT